MHWLFWAPLAAAVAHIFEEFAYPGGFAQWDREFRPSIRASITPRLHLLMNGLLLFLCVFVAVTGPTLRGVATWLTLVALLASNAVFHVVGAFRTRRYSPGMATALTLYVPLAIYGFTHFVHSGAASVGTAVVAALVGGSYHLWMSFAHALRAQRASA